MTPLFFFVNYCFSDRIVHFTPFAPDMVNILLVATSSDSMPLKDGTGNHQTGAWLEEIASPYLTFREAGHDVTIASPAGGKIPIDAGSQNGDAYTAECKQFMEDAGCAKLIAESLSVSAVSTEDFSAIFLAGGHGTYGDFVSNPELKGVIEGFYQAGKVVSAVCHGQTSLVDCTNAEGEPIVKGATTCCFSDEEETMVGLAEKVPFMLESRLKELGAISTCGAAWGSTTQTHKDGKHVLVTGQNPASSKACAQAVVKAL